MENKVLKKLTLMANHMTIVSIPFKDAGSEPKIEVKVIPAQMGKFIKCVEKIDYTNDLPRKSFRLTNQSCQPANVELVECAPVEDLFHCTT